MAGGAGKTMFRFEYKHRGRPDAWLSLLWSGTDEDGRPCGTCSFLSHLDPSQPFTSTDWHGKWWLQVRHNDTRLHVAFNYKGNTGDLRHHNFFYESTMSGKQFQDSRIYAHNFTEKGSGYPVLMSLVTISRWFFTPEKEEDGLYRIIYKDKEDLGLWADAGDFESFEDLATWVFV
jgi:hypothetical protein